MNIPAFINPKFVQHEGDRVGFLTPQMQSYTDQLNQALQNNVGQNGFAISPQPDTNVADALANMPVGTLLFDTTNDEWVGKTSGGLVKLTYTPYP